jgi:predicted nuclease of predicted toxin-antitoxin system
VISLLLDEGVSPSLTKLLAECDFDAVALRDRSRLRLEDHEVWELALTEARTVVTINARHFRRLASITAWHPGVLVIPSGGTRTEQYSYITSAVDWVTAAFPDMPGFTNYFVEVFEDGLIAGAEIVGEGAIPRPRLQSLN